jgi:hypothetical protein
MAFPEERDYETIWAARFRTEIYFGYTGGDKTGISED